jgi:serine/threonine protein kinase
MLLTDDTLKLADFGSCRGVKSKQPFTEYISTRWYRAPECLLTDGYYSYKMDVWGTACVIFEVVALFPLFAGTDEIDQVQKIHNIMGTPSPEVLAKFKRRSQMNFNFPPKKGRGLKSLLPGADPALIDLLEGMLKYDPAERFSARDALKHAWFKEIRDRERKLLHERRKAAGTEGPERPPAAAGGRRRQRENEAPNPKPAVRTVRVRRTGAQQSSVAKPEPNSVRRVANANANGKAYQSLPVERRRNPHVPTGPAGKAEADTDTLPAVYGSSTNPPTLQKSNSHRSLVGPAPNSLVSSVSTMKLSDSYQDGTYGRGAAAQQQQQQLPQQRHQQQQQQQQQQAPPQQQQQQQPRQPRVLERRHLAARSSLPNLG